MLADTNFFFGSFLYSAQDLSHKTGKSWTLLIRVSMSLIVEVHGVDGVGEGVVIWVEPILFVSVADSYWSPKVLELYNHYLKRSCMFESESIFSFLKAKDEIPDEPFFANIVNGYKPLTIFAKNSIIDAWLCSKYTTVSFTLHFFEEHNL